MNLGIAFGGGGARGAAHIGVLMELERLRLRPSVVAGTSIGGLVAALVAAGLDSGSVLQVLKGLDFNRVYALPGRKPALVSNRKLESLLVRHIGRPTFADLKIPLAVVVIDLVSREELVLREGDVVSAVLATTAFPVVLPPVKRNGRLLIDGGLMNNTPFDVARQLGADFVLAIDLANSDPYGTPIKQPKSMNFFTWLLNYTARQPIYQILSTAADILTTQGVEARKMVSPPDLMLQPEMGTIGYFEFHRLEEGIAAGRAATQAAEGLLSKLQPNLPRMGSEKND